MIQFQRVSVVRSDDCPVLARFTTGEAALIDCASGNGAAYALGVRFGPRQSRERLPAARDLVPFLHESVRYVTGGSQRSTDYLVADVPAGVAPIPG
ncbi:MAG: hypothetical protein QM736_12445 [Vicinamibacterales bacterium]